MPYAFNKCFSTITVYIQSSIRYSEKQFLDVLSPANSNSFFIGPLLLGKKKSYDFTTVSVSVCQ